MSTKTPQEQQLAAPARIRKVFGASGDLYEIIFVDHHGRPVVTLTEWYRLRKFLPVGDVTGLPRLRKPREQEFTRLFSTVMDLLG